MRRSSSSRPALPKSAQRANDIIVRIQDMAGKRATANTSLEFNDVVQQCLAFLRHESDDKRVTMKAKLQPNLPSIRGDRIQLQQVIVNLIINSIQAMNSAPETRREIHLETSLDESNVSFSIRDTGIGIPIEHMDHIFDGFFTTKEGGLGIGLAICQSIINTHGGSITAANHPEGGAIFRFSIPTRCPGASSGYPTAAIDWSIK